MSLTKIPANYFSLAQTGLPAQAGWKHGHNLKKKAVEQKFSWSGLLISLSIAFFIVIISAFLLNFINRSIITNKTGQVALDSAQLSQNF